MKKQGFVGRHMAVRGALSAGLCAVVLALGGGMRALGAGPAGGTRPAPAAPPVRYVLLPDGDVLEDARAVFVRLKAQFHNDSDREVTVPLWGRTDFAELFRFEIVGPDGKALAGPIIDRFGGPVPALPSTRATAPMVGNSPFVLVKAHAMVECSFMLSHSQGIDFRGWFFTHPGKYTIIGEFVNTHDTYVDPQTYAVAKAEQSFLGSVKSQPIQCAVTHHGAEWGIQMPGSQRPGGLQPMQYVEVGGDKDGRGGLTVTGSIVDGQGKPLAGAMVEISADKDTGVPRGGGGAVAGGILHKPVDRQRSGADGRVVFDELPPGMDSYTLTAIHEGNYEIASATITLADAVKKQEVKIALKPGLVLSGKVVDTKGKALPGVRAQNQARMTTVYTGADGKFLLEGLSKPACNLYSPGFSAPGSRSPVPGHENDGTWEVVMEPQAPAAAPAATPGRRGG